jgi:hypothetical protein
VMALVPLMTTDEERRSGRRRAALVHIGGVFVVLISMAVIALSTLRP